jgi:hypothetical protein
MTDGRANVAARLWAAWTRRVWRWLDGVTGEWERDGWPRE